jgi:transposase-like protein
MVSSRCWQVEGDAATISGMKRTTLPQRAPATGTISHAGYRFPPDVISYAVWLYYHFPLSLRMVEELLAARGIELTYETVRHWAVKFGLGIARRIRSTALARGDKWHPDEGVSRTQAKACGAVLKMGVGLPESACRSRLQTARCCCVQKAWW